MSAAAFVRNGLPTSARARALRRGTGLRSCPATEHRALARHKQSTGLFVSGLAPPGRLASGALRFGRIRPSSSTSLHRAPHHTARSSNVAVEFPGVPPWSAWRRTGDRRSEVKEEGPIESTGSDLWVDCPGDMSEAGHPASSARARRCMPPHHSDRPWTNNATLPHRSARSSNVEFEFRRALQWSSLRMSGDRRIEVREEGAIQSTRSDLPVGCPRECARTQTVQWTVCVWRAPGAPPPGMSGVVHPTSSARADGRVATVRQTR